MAEDLARIAFDAALRSLDKQDALLTELRARTGLLLAASSVAASFLGDPALEEGSRHVAIAALCAFAVSVLASLYVLFPRRDIVVSLDGPELYERLSSSPTMLRRYTGGSRTTSIGSGRPTTARSSASRGASAWR